MRAISIHRRCLQDIGVDPETGEFDADAIETGTTKSQRDRVQLVYQLVRELDQMDDHRYGAPHEKIVELGEQNGYDRDKIEKSIENLKQRRDGIYEPKDDYYKPS